MTNDFAAAMRRAALSTRAYDVVEATRIIQDALARQASVGTYHAPRPDKSSRKSNSRPALRLIDPNAEIIEPSKAPEPSTGGHGGSKRPLQRLRKPLGEVLQILREGRLSTEALASLTSVESLRTKPRCPPPPIADGAQFVTRSFAGAAGTRSYKLYIPACAAGWPAWPHRHAAWLQAEPGRFCRRHRHERRRRGAWSHGGLPEPVLVGQCRLVLELVQSGGSDPRLRRASDHCGYHARHRRPNSPSIIASVRGGPIGWRRHGGGHGRDLSRSLCGRRDLFRAGLWVCERCDVGLCRHAG